MLDLAAAAGRHENEGVFVVGFCVRHVGNKRRQTPKRQVAA
jgi:hypothetical protein